MSTTICAISTALGGAIGIVRLSGSHAITIADTIFTPAAGKSTLAERKANTTTFGRITNAKGEVIDEVIATIFRAPHSFTGEDSVEFSCHGSSFILQSVMQLLLDSGATAAGPGEYTQRAFLNGKMDLSQAEAVADLIASTNATSHRMALNQMRGRYSTNLVELRDKLLHITSLLELELDFSEEDVEFADRQQLTSLTDEISDSISSLVNSFAAGKAIKEGIPVAIIGETNAGKSTLLNQLLGDERAIVSDIHGTTRDVIEDTAVIGGTLFRFIDTAGIRETSDKIESIGIERTFKKLSQASIVLWLIDNETSQQQFDELYAQITPLCKEAKLLVVQNKCDVDSTPLCRVPESIATISISAKDGTNLNLLTEKLVAFAALPELDSSTIIVSNARHYEALTHAQEAILRVNEGLQSGIPGDLIAQDLRECLFHLAEILGGEITTDEVLGNIFKNFCIGK